MRFVVDRPRGIVVTVRPNGGRYLSLALLKNALILAIELEGYRHGIEDVFESDSPDKDIADANFSRFEMDQNLTRFIRAEARRQTDFRPFMF